MLWLFPHPLYCISTNSMTCFIQFEKWKSAFFIFQTLLNIIKFVLIHQRKIFYIWINLFSYFPLIRSETPLFQNLSNFKSFNVHFHPLGLLQVFTIWTKLSNLCEKKSNLVQYLLWKWHLWLLNEFLIFYTKLFIHISLGMIMYPFFVYNPLV